MGRNSSALKHKGVDGEYDTTLFTAHAHILFLATFPTKSIELHTIYAMLKHPSCSFQCQGISGLGCVSLMSLTWLMIVCVHVSMHTCMYLYYNKVNQIYDRYSGSQCVSSKGNSTWSSPLICWSSLDCLYGIWDSFRENCPTVNML